LRPGSAQTCSGSFQGFTEPAAGWGAYFERKEKSEVRGGKGRRKERKGRERDG